MEIRLVGAQLFYAGGRTVGQTDRYDETKSLFAVLRTYRATLQVVYSFHSTRVVPKVMSNFYLHANWEQQMKESAVVDGTSCCVILECLVTSIACIT